MGYTFGERLGLVRHTVQGARRAHLGLDTGRNDNGIDNIRDARAERHYREAAAAEALVEHARDAVAAAKAQVRAAKPKDRPAARQAQREVERGLRRAEAAARRFR